MSDKFLNNMTQEERDNYHAEIFGISAKKWREDIEKQKKKQEDEE